jgi:hypothetical protein
MWENRLLRAPGAAVPDVRVAGRAAVERFWGLLSEFAAVGRAPGRWRRLLPAGSPFLHYPQPAGALAVHRRVFLE